MSGGNIYTEEVEGIQVHRYGAHIFHTSDPSIWNYVNQFADFNRYTNSPVARYKDELYNLPFNMNTFHQLWGVITPAEAKEMIERQKKECGINEPKNLEAHLPVFPIVFPYNLLPAFHKYPDLPASAPALPDSSVR